MTAQNTINGKAFEYACLKAISDRLKEEGNEVSTVVSPALNTAKASFNKLPEDKQNNLCLAAKTAVRLLFPLEPRLKSGENTLFLAINADSAAIGSEGDVRDVLCIRHDNNWEIGMSCKHNHEALKHPRITESMDFGSDWIGYPCSKHFLEVMRPVIEPLISFGENKILWRNIPDKQETYYVPILQAYLDEIISLCSIHPDAPEKLLSYFFGSKDFYKVIAKEADQTTTIEGFNMHGTLNQPYGKIRALTRVPVIHMPTRLIEARFKPGSMTTIILTFDGGWSVSMRLHNKDDIAKPTSLAWDVNLQGLPTGTYVNTHAWHEFDYDSFQHIDKVAEEKE